MPAKQKVNVMYYRICWMLFGEVYHVFLIDIKEYLNKISYKCIAFINNYFYNIIQASNATFIDAVCMFNS
ncbi:hypothetical protein Aasi_1690 [Candidatus Amoebophilus asiaticus 5a2]|uniref:Uncharacterized protein n=1 Tax=Amoebophilus asiaticus (strain 5a2) TaxID=452471 RepID=C3L3U3_AMOA5|nr:hypothetical protein Aasi_1690 [Candidatus Amoebophilus asiaticus 5a2]